MSVPTHKSAPIYTTPEAEGLTQEEIDDIVEDIESDDHRVNGHAIVLVKPRGRQSLTAPGVHSPLVSTRVTPELLAALRSRAGDEGISVSELQRRILAEYFARA